MNTPRYIGFNNVSDTVIDNSAISFTGTDYIRIRIMMISATQFKYSINAGFTYIATNTADTSNSFDLGTTGFGLGSIGISIKFTTISGLSSGDYWEFDCCAPYVSGLVDEDGKVIPPNEKNFLGQFGRVFPKDELRDSGFEVMMRHPNTYVLDSQKFSYFFINEQNSYWELTDNLRLQGSLCLNTCLLYTSDAADE